MKLPVRSLAAGAALAVIVGGSQSAAAAPPRPPRAARAPARGKTAPPKPTASRPLEATPTRFEFERRSGSVDQALTALLGRQGPALPSDEEAGQRMAEVSTAHEVLRAHAPEAAAAVVAELAKVPATDVEAHAVLFSLLAEVHGEGAAVEALSRTVQSGTPRPRPRHPEATRQKKPSHAVDEPRTHRPEYEDPEVIIRYLAMGHLYRAARAGNEMARAAILEAAGSPHPEVRVSAVQYTYALVRRRWKARLELEKRLPPTDRSLLYRY